MKKTLLTVSTLLTCIAVQAQTLVTFFTTSGNFEVEIYDDIAPITGGNFLDLVNAKYYDGIIFHRVMDNFMIQGGDPTGTGTGGPGYTIADEFAPNLSNVQKTISMANAGPETGGSQFFINLVNNPFLDHDKAPLTSKHPVFGKVTENFSVVQNIGDVDVNDANNKPLIDVVMDSIRVGSLALLTLPEADGFVEMDIVPNPTNESSNLLVKANETEFVNVQITDVLGRLIINTTIQLQHGVNQIQLSSLLTTSLEKGYYNLSLANGKKGNKTIHFIVE